MAEYDKEDKFIATIRSVRNAISHSATSELSNEEFDDFWDRMSSALVNLGADESELNNIKSIDLSKVNAVEDTTNSEADQLKKKANQEFKESRYSEAIEIYSRILQLPGLSSDYQAVIYSNRSIAYLRQGTESSKSKATQDAKLAVQLRPSWWRGYYRLGNAYRERNKMSKALVQMKTAFALNPSQKEIKDELYVINQEVGIQSREEHLVPQPHLDTEAEMFEKMSIRTGMPVGEIAKLTKNLENDPVYGCVMRAERYRDGRGVNQDYTQAAKLYAKAANEGNPEGMYNLAKLHGAGKGVKRDFETSLFWLRKAANMTPKLPFGVVGIAEAQHSLGLRYADGVGVQKDVKEAAKWYKKAVENNVGASANNLGLLYKNGTGVERSLEKAFQHFQLAAERKDTPGMMNLAECYFLAEGTGSLVATDEDINKGMEWLRRAASLGDLAAVKEIEELERLSPQDKLRLRFVPEHGIMPEGTGFRDSLSIDYKQYLPDVRAAAKKGSTTAIEVLTIWDCMQAAMSAFKQNDYSKLVAELSKAIRLDHQLVTIHDLFIPVLKQRFENYPEELETIVCHVRMNTREAKYLPHFLSECLLKFPTDSFLLEMRAICYCTMQQPLEALKLLESALKSHPNNTRLLYVRATVFTQMKPPPDETIKAWDAFLGVASKDHPKIPAAHYQKAIYYFNKLNMSKFTQSYEDGLGAEKLQLPCLIPYDFPPKYDFEKYYTLTKQLPSTTGGTK